jgi:hypothetical protein
MIELLQLDAAADHQCLDRRSGDEWNGNGRDKGTRKKFAKVQRSLLCNSRFNPFCDGVKAKLLD